MCIGARECGVSRVVHRPWEAEQEHEAKMAVRPTSVPPSGWLLSAATLPHTLDEKKKGHSLQSLRKHACLCLSCKQTLGPLSGSAFAFHKADGVPVVSDHILAVCAML